MASYPPSSKQGFIIGERSSSPKNEYISKHPVPIASPITRQYSCDTTSSKHSATVMSPVSRTTCSSVHDGISSRQISSLNSSSSEVDVCRICHSGSSIEQLLSPCYCTGSMGKFHLSCLQRWLGSSNKSTCEICDFKFTLERKTKPFKLFLKNPGTPRDKRNMTCDLICFLMLTPLSTVTAWMCIKGAARLNFSTAETTGLVTLSVCLIVLYSTWLAVCIRHYVNLWTDWKQFNQDVKIKCHPPSQVVSNVDGVQIIQFHDKDDIVRPSARKSAKLKNKSQSQEDQANVPSSSLGSKFREIVSVSNPSYIATDDEMLTKGARPKQATNHSTCTYYETNIDTCSTSPRSYVVVSSIDKGWESSKCLYLPRENLSDVQHSNRDFGASSSFKISSRYNGQGQGHQESNERLRNHQESNERPRNHQVSNERPRNHQESNEMPRNHQESNEMPRNHQEFNERPRNHQVSNEMPRNHQESNERPRNNQDSIVSTPVNRSRMSMSSDDRFSQVTEPELVRINFSSPRNSDKMSNKSYTTTPSEDHIRHLPLDQVDYDTSYQTQRNPRTGVKETYI